MDSDGRKRNAYRKLVGKPERKRQLGRSRCRWEHNIKIDLRERAWNDMDWLDLAQDKGQWQTPVNTVMNFQVP
jgi:hypothetical protein